MNWIELINTLVESARGMKGREDLDRVIIEQAANWVKDFKLDNPIFAFFVDGLINGTPQDALLSLAAFNREAACLPFMTQFLQMLQTKLRQK